MIRDKQRRPARDAERNGWVAAEREAPGWALTCADCGAIWPVTVLDIAAGDAWASCPRCHRRMIPNDIGSPTGEPADC